jgi:hypothetical protein
MENIEAIANSTGPLTIEEMIVMYRDLRKITNKLLEENFELAAHQCCVKGALVGDAYGSQFCALVNRASVAGVAQAQGEQAEGVRGSCAHKNSHCVYESDDGEFERWQCKDCGRRWGREIAQ